MRKKALCDLTPHPPNIHSQGDDQDLNHCPVNCHGLGENEIGPFGDVLVMQVTVYECITELIDRCSELETGSVWSCWIFLVSVTISLYFWNYPMVLCKQALLITIPRKNEGTKCFFSCTTGFFMSAPVRRAGKSDVV